MADGGLVRSTYNDYFAVPGLSVNAPAGIDIATGARGLLDRTESVAGALTVNQPTDPASDRTTSGGFVRAFFDDFYNRIYIEPRFIDFGAVGAESTAVVRIWNAYYRRTVTLDSLSYDPTVGLTVTGMVPPTAFKPLQEIAYEVSALAEGPASFNTSVTWGFDVPWVYQQPVSGSRAKLWLFAPNWPPGGKNYTLTYSFKTEIITSRSGREQRIALRKTPRRSLSYRVLLRKEALVEFNDTMRFWQARTFMLPELPRFVTATSEMAADGFVMQVDSVPAWVTVGVQVALKHENRMEVRQIESLIGNTVVFKTTSPLAWPIGTKMHYGMTGFMATSLSAPRETNYHAQLDLEFDINPLSDKYIAPAAPTRTLAGREVFLKRPNWAVQVGATIEREVEELDYDRGPVARFTPVEFPRETRKLTFVGRTFAEMEEIREFFYRMKGQQGEFYAPTWEYDFKPKVTIQAGTSNVRIFGTEFSTIYGDTTVYRAIFVLMNNGDVLVRKVNTILPVVDGDGSDSFITVTEPWDREISVSNIVMCGWMPAWRLSSDILTVEWLTNSVAQTQLAMQTIEDLPVETA